MSFTSIELDEARASAAQTVFADTADVTVLQGDAGRHYWLTHPDVLATEIRVAPDMSVIVAQHTPNRLTQGV